MDNKDPWVSYDKVSTSSDAFAYVQEIGNDLSDSLEHLNQGSPVRAKGLPTEKYTAGNTNDVMEGVHEESFLTQTPSKISRRYSPLTKSEYSGYRPPDPVFLSYNNNQTTNTFLPEPLAKHKTVDDIDKQQINNKFVVNKISSTSREAAIAPEALELINILNPIEAKEIQSNTLTQETITEKYTSSVKPIEVKKLETKINTVVQQSAPIVISKPKTLITNSQQNTTKIQEDTQSTNIFNEVNELESTGPTYNNLNQNTNISSNTEFNIEVKKPVVTPKISQYTNTIDFNSFVSSTFAEIVDQKSEQKILSKNNINVRKLVTNINAFLEQNKKEFKSNLSNSVNDFFSTYSDENLTTLQSSILNTINTTNNIESLDSSVSRVVNHYFSKNQNEFSQSLVNEFTNSFSANLRTQLSVLQNNSATETNVLQNINNAINNVKNIYESKQVEIENIVSEVNNENILSKVVELANTYQEYQSLTTNSIQNISSQINQTNISELKEIFNQQVNNISAKTDTALSNYKQEMFGFLYSYISNSVSQDVFENLSNILNSSNTIEQINLSVNQFVSNVKTEDNSQAINSLQYYSNDKYSNIVSSLLVETIENNILKSLSNVVQNYSNPANIQNTLTNQVKNEIAEFFTSEIKNTVNKFDFAELKTSIENAYKSQDINEFKSEFNNALNKSENSSNSLAISHLNSLLENNLSQFTLKSANVLNETKYANSVKNIVNDNLHNVVSNIVNNLSEVNTYSENKNIATLLNNIKIINDRLLVNNAENRLQNFNLIQTSIDNFLSNTENNYNDKLSNIKLNTSNINSEILTNINIFESLKTDSNTEYLNVVKNIISTTNTQSFNEESKKFIDEVKVYTDLINMKNQITSELDNFVSNTFEAILEVNQNSTLISSQQVVNLIEEAVSTFNSSNVSSKAITHIKNVLNDVKRPELYSNTFQLITSTSILEEQVKNYLLQNNSILADYSLQQIMNTINQPLYSSYVTFQDIKEIINKSNSSSSFAILSEIKQYINQINSEENNQFVSNLKTYLNETSSSLNVKNSYDFTEDLKSFVNQQNIYSPESFNQIINSVTNKFENKSAVFLNNIINENVSKFNNFVETLFASLNSTQSKEEILNTLSSFTSSIDISSESQSNEQNYLTQNSLTDGSMNLNLEAYKFNFENEFKEYVKSIYNNSNEDNVKNELNIFKQEILNTAISNSLQVLNTSQTKVDSLEKIVNNSSLSVEEKSTSILEVFNSVINSKQYTTQETKNLESIRNYFLNESFKIETLNKISQNNSFSAQDLEVFENEFNIRLQQYIFTPSFIETINNFRKNIFESKNLTDIISFSDEQKNTILNDFKTVAVNIITANYPEYLNTESYNALNTVENIQEFSNLLSQEYTQQNSIDKIDIRSIKNIAFSTLLEQSTFMSRVYENVTNILKSENTINKSSIIEAFDNLLFTSIENKFNLLNNLLIENAIINITKNSNERNESNQVNNELVTSVIKNNLSFQKDYIEQILNSFKISSVSEQIQNQNETVLQTLSTVVQNYNVAKLLTNTISENISLNQNIVNSQVIENVNKILEENGNIYNSSQSSEEILQSISNNTNITEQILNTFNKDSVTNLFNQNLLFDINKNSTELRTLLSEKQNNDSIQINDEYINQIQNVLNLMSQTNNTNNSDSLINDIETRVEKIENITLDFENKTSYQKSKIEVYDEINNIIQTNIHPSYNQVNLAETSVSYESTNTDNEFKNITVVKQIEENEDVQISNLRIEKVWNKFIQEEVNKIVEEVNNSSESSINENTYNQQKSTVNQSNKTENFNNLEYNHLSNEKNSTENLNVYNTFNNQQPGTTTPTQETEERVDYREITELVFTKIEEKLKTFSVTEEDIIILKHKILTEVTEIYEKRSQLDFKKSEEKMKKEMKDLFIRFLNS